MAQTAIYGLGYLEPYENVGDVLDMDARRFQAIESQFLNLYTVFGNGIIDNDPLNPSWLIQTVPGGINSSQILITPGHGHVAWKAAATTSSTLVNLPQAASGYPAQFWIYARQNDTTPDQRTVDFIASTVEIIQPDYYIGLGGVVLSQVPGDIYIVVTPYNDSAHGRVNISLFATLASIINKHLHIGGASNPSPIDLGLHVQGRLDGSNIINLDLGSVTKGNLDPNRLPVIDHAALSRIGTLTHAEIDSLLAGLRQPQGYRLSDLMVANMLQLALSLKLQSGLSRIDSTLINAILYVPGITPTSFEAWHATGDSGSDNTVPSTLTLANIDHVNHQIVGNVATPINTDMLVFTTLSDFTSAQAAGAARTVSNLPISMDTVVMATAQPEGGALTIAQPLNYLSVSTTDFDNYQPNSVGKWLFSYRASENAATTTITPPAPPALSAPNFKNELADKYGFARYFYVNFDNPVDWTLCQRLGIGYGLASASIPGDISVFLVMDGGTPITIVQGGQNVTISVSTPAILRSRTDTSASTRVFHINNLSEFNLTSAQQSAVLGIGFFWQTSSGWNSQEVDFYLVSPNSDEISAVTANSQVIQTRSTLPDVTSAIFVWNDNFYAPLGRLVFRFNSGNVNTKYDVVITNVDLPAQLRISTRVALDEASLGTTLAYSLSAGNVDANSRSGQWFDIIVELIASADLLTAPSLSKLSLVFESAGLPASKTWNTQALWEQGVAFTNITATTDNYLHLTDSSQVGAFRYTRDKNSYSAFYQSTASGGAQSYTETVYQDGSHLYSTPNQVWLGGGKGFSTPRDMQSLPSGHIIMADTQNDRIVELDAFGNLVRAIQGNLYLSQISRDFVALSATYNPRLRTLWVAFSQLVSISDRTMMALTSGQNAISLADPALTCVLFSPINGKSATIQVVFSAAQQAQIAGWTSPAKLVISSGAVTAQGSQVITPGGSPPAYSFSVGALTSTNALPASLQALYKDNYGADAVPAWLQGLPIPTVSTSSGGGILGDFNGDGQVNSTLQGPGGQIGSVILSILSAEVVYDNIYQPISVQVDTLGNWIVGMVGTDTAVSYNTNSLKLWAIPSSVALMQDGKGGSVYQMLSGNVLIATPAPYSDSTGTGQLFVINRKTSNVVIVHLPMAGDAVRAIPNSDETQFYVAVDDVIGGGRASRIIIVNSSGKVVWNSGYGIVSHPTGLSLLPNGQILVSE